MPLKMLYGTEVKPPAHPLKISRVGNLIMVKWSLKYVAFKSFFYALFQYIPKILLTDAKK